MVSADDPALLEVAIRELKRGLAQEPNEPIGWRALGLAHARKGEHGEADLASAQLHWMSGDLDEAKRYAGRAQQKLKRGSPGWLQADDILTYKPPRL
jgi:predicted Zn-dependent protease